MGQSDLYQTNLQSLLNMLVVLCIVASCLPEEINFAACRLTCENQIVNYNITTTSI